MGEHPKRSKSYGDFELLDAAGLDLFPLKTLRRGVSTWKVADYAATESNAESSYDDNEPDNDRAGLTWFDSYEQALEAGIEKAAPSMWPALGGDNYKLDLSKCLRLWPHDHDTGGFFVALIQRTK